MPRSKDIHDYFEISLSTLVADRETTFDLHLYFPRSNHVLLWRKAGERMDLESLDRYRAKGLSQFWIHQSDRAALDSYLHPKATKTLKPEPEPVSEPLPEPEPEPVPAPTVEATTIIEALKSVELPEEKKIEVVAAQAQTALRDTATAPSIPAQQVANQHARKIVQEVLSGVQNEAQSIASEIWKLSNIDPCFVHSVNVATYAVLFALAFGKIDISLMTDLALAALLHDIGLSQIDADVAATPMRELNAAQTKVYGDHVLIGQDLLRAYGMGISPRVKIMIEQHHEKFDGTGYPQKIQGFHLDDVAQLLAMAELLESACSGTWDGVSRTLGDALDTLEQLEKARTFPEHFNPDVFAAVMRWTRNPDTANATRAALDVVKNQTQTLIQAAR